MIIPRRGRSGGGVQDVATGPRPSQHNQENDRAARRGALRLPGLRLARTVALSCGLFAIADYALAQQTPVCTNTPAPDERIVCEEDASSDDQIRIQLEGVDINVTTTLTLIHAVHAKHEGSGDIDIDVTGGFDGFGRPVRDMINTSGGIEAFGIYGEHGGTGAIDISVSGAAITTTGRTGRGVYGRHSGSGRISLVVSGSQIETAGQDAEGISAWHATTAADADASVSVSASFNEIITEGFRAYGIRGTSRGRGNVAITTEGNTITTKEKSAHAIFGYHLGEGDIVIRSTRDTIVTEHETAVGDPAAYGILAYNQGGDGDIYIDVAEGLIMTAGAGAYGIFSWHAGNGSSRTVAGRGQRIATTGAGAHGILAYHQSGDIYIEVAEGSIMTAGAGAYGIYSRHLGSGSGRIVAGGGQSITTTGAGAHGILAYHQSGDIYIEVAEGSIMTAGAGAYGIFSAYAGSGPDRSTDVRVGGAIETKGTNADGVRVGSVSSGNAQFAAAFDDEGYRRQTVTLTGRIATADSGAAGVFLGGGGRVYIGPTGVIDAASRIAVLADGDTPGENPGDPAVKPKLFVGLEFGGRRPEDILGDGWIINRGGETTIAVNGVVLHDGATGVVPDAKAPNGAWDVTIREEGVNVVDHSDPDNWVIEDLPLGDAADRDFSAADFILTKAYAPRSALYEALPGFLLTLHEQGTREARESCFGPPVWARLSGGGGRHKPDRSNTAAEWDFSYHALEGGLNIAFGESLSASVSGRSLHSSADISAPGNGGGIEARGTGGAFDICATGPGGNYARGGLSWSSYGLDFSSDGRGLLKNSASARAHSLDFEAGRRMTMDDGARLTFRTRLRWTEVGVDEFADAADSFVSMGDASRLAGGIGLVVETAIGAVVLRGSADLERTFDGSVTRVLVSGEELVAETSPTLLGVGFGVAYRRDGFSVDAAVSAAGSGSDDVFYSGMLTLSVAF